MMPIPCQVAHDLVSKDLDRPAVFKGMLGHWPCSDWQLQQWADRLGQTRIKFRLGPIFQVQKGPLWEGDCEFLLATVKEFVAWTEQKEKLTEDNAFYGFDPDKTWCYADYKYMSEMFQSDIDMLKMVDWSMFGFKSRSGAESTIWIGSRGAHTPCHYDAYGYNIVAQVYGKKHWTLFPPIQSNLLLPTRIPFEESSIFSSVNLLDPNLLQTYPQLQHSTPYSVCLEPGDVLFVPHNWWHFVESVEASVSINTWIGIDLDDDCRIEEGISKTLVTLFAQNFHFDGWLNPTEEPVSCHETMYYLQSALKRSVCSKPKPLLDDGTIVTPEATASDVIQEPVMKRQRLEEYVEQKRATKLSETVSCYSQHVQVLRALPFEEYIAIRRAWHKPAAAASALVVGSEHGIRGQSSYSLASLKIVPRAGSSKGDTKADTCHQQKNAVTHQSNISSAAASCADPELVREKYAEGSANPLSPGSESQSDSQTSSSSGASNCDTDIDFFQLVLNCVVHPSIVSEIAKLLKSQYVLTQARSSNT